MGRDTGPERDSVSKFPAHLSSHLHSAPSCSRCFPDEELRLRGHGQNNVASMEKKPLILEMRRESIFYFQSLLG